MGLNIRLKFGFKLLIFVKILIGFILLKSVGFSNWAFNGPLFYISFLLKNLVGH